MSILPNRAEKIVRRFSVRVCEKSYYILLVYVNNMNVPMNLCLLDISSNVQLQFEFSYWLCVKGTDFTIMYKRYLVGCRDNKLQLRHCLF